MAVPKVKHNGGEKLNAEDLRELPQPRLKCRGNFSLNTALRLTRCYRHSHKERAQMETRNNMPPAPTVLAADQARQGVTGHNVRYVLGFGIVGTVISFIIVGFLTTHGLFGALW
jgi:hypothetical protein